MFDDLEYTRQRLTKTIVRIKDRPIFIREIHGRGEMEYFYLNNPVDEQVGRLEELNLEAVPLGYINFDGGSVYAMRKPMRGDWRQGLRLANMFFEGGCPFMELPYTGLHKTIVGDYVSPKKLEKLLKKPKDKLAFHRHWAADGMGTLFYKDNVVGEFNGGFNLSPNYIHLNEYMHEVVEDANNL